MRKIYQTLSFGHVSLIELCSNIRCTKPSQKAPITFVLCLWLIDSGLVGSTKFSVGGVPRE